MDVWVPGSTVLDTVVFGDCVSGGDGGGTVQSGEALFVVAGERVRIGRWGKGGGEGDWGEGGLRL